jgi:hypothetical protein
MKYQFGDRSNEESRAAKIRALFKPGTTIAEHAEYCLREGVCTESEILGMASRAFRNEVRAALGALTAEGVPFAGPTGTRKDQAPVWRQMEFWSKKDFDYNYSAYKRREMANGFVAGNIARLCLQRYGVEPTFIEGEPEGEE